MSINLAPARVAGIIQDAIWWLKGFGAAQVGHDTNTTAELARSLRSVVNYIDALSTGETRLIGQHERYLAIAVREGEFEMIIDAFRESATGRDILLANQTINRIWEQFRREVLEVSDLEDQEVPF